MAKKNAFEELLASISEDTDRQVITGLAEKYPNLRDSVMMRSDYSRNMDELRAEREQHSAELAYAAAMKKWREENWIENAYGDGKGALKRELDKDARISELEQQIQVGGEVTFEDLNKYLGEKGFVSQDAVNKLVETRLSGEKQTVEQMLAGLSHIAVKAPKLATRHFKTYGEELDTEELATFANKNGINDLERAYDSFTAEKRAALEKKRHEEELESVRKAAREEAEKELAARQPAARVPGDDGGPEMGHFQRKILGIKPEGDKTDADLPFGRGAIADRAAREWNATTD